MINLTCCSSKNHEGQEVCWWTCNTISIVVALQKALLFCYCRQMGSEKLKVVIHFIQKFNLKLHNTKRGALNLDKDIRNLASPS